MRQGMVCEAREAKQDSISEGKQSQQDMLPLLSSAGSGGDVYEAEAPSTDGVRHHCHICNLVFESAAELFCHITCSVSYNRDMLTSQHVARVKALMPLWVVPREYLLASNRVHGKATFDAVNSNDLAL